MPSQRKLETRLVGLFESSAPRCDTRADRAGLKVLSSDRLDTDDAVWLAKTAHNFAARVVYHAAQSDLAVLFDATSRLFELATSATSSSDLLARASLQHHSLSSAFAALFAHFQLADLNATGLLASLQRVQDLLEAGPSPPDCEDEYSSIARSVVGIQLELAARRKDWPELKRIIEVCTQHGRCKAHRSVGV